MSNQPSNLDTLKDSASSAYADVARAANTSGKDPTYNPDKDTKNFTKDLHGNTIRKGDFKDQLNDAALGASSKEEQTVLEKVRSYIPALHTLPQTAEGEAANGVVDKEEPPRRPEHDVQVEQFLRGQYHSRSGQGMTEPAKRD